MRNTTALVLMLAFIAVPVALAQETPSPAATATATPAPMATATPAPAPARSVRISFVPPPLEGTISLGIYSREGKLVRVLVQEGAIDEFDVGADALTAKWDGKNDQDEDLPAGKYHARGYMVGRLKVEDMGAPEGSPPDLAAADHVQVKLMPNPLSKDAKLAIDLGVGSEDEQIVLKTTDGLPLFSVIEAPQLVRVAVTKSGEKAIDVWADGGGALDRVHVSNVDQMMAFDCGEIELK